jgi:hypothetical protein
LWTDSEYVRRGLRFGLPQWRKNGWQWERFGLLSPISHADLWQRLDRALQIHRVEFRAWRLDAGPAAVGAEPAPSPPPCRKRPAWRAFGERWQRWLTTLRSVGRSRPRAARWCAS